MARSFLNLDSARLGAKNNVTLATTSTSVVSAAFGAQTYQIRVASPVACFYKVDDVTPTAVVSDAYLPANWVEYVTVSPGQKIALVTAGTDPTTVSVIEVTQ